MSRFDRKILRQGERKKERKPAGDGWGEIVVTGTSCLWWDSGARAGKTAPFNGHAFPCCPHCGSLLMQFDNEESFLEGADEYEANGHPGYRARLAWIRGKCFKTMEEAVAAWELAKEEEKA